MESEVVMKENNDLHLQKSPKPEQKEKEVASSSMESEVVMEENDDPHLQKPPKPEQKEKEVASSPMESEVVMKENVDPHLQKPPKPEQKEKEVASSSSSPSQEIKTQSPIHDSSSSKPQSPNMEGYDPNRIPSSVFSTKTTGTSNSQAEWSGTSNESLFSIQMGNNSFSNDYAIMYGKSQDFDLNTPPQLKSGELPRLDNNNRHNNNVPPKSGDFTSLPPVMEQDEGGLQSGQSPNSAFRTPASPQANNPRISTDSNKSFAFPVLTNVSGKKEQSIKVEPEKNEQRAVEQVQPPAQKPNKWFSCFSCSSCC